MKKLVQINVTCNGSTGRIMEQIQKRAKNEGYQAITFYGRGKPSNKDCIKIDSKIEVLWHLFISRMFNAQGHGSKFATYRMIKKIKKIEPDIVHLHNLHGYYINFKQLFKFLKKQNIPVVWTLHDCWAFTGHCACYTANNCEKWKNSCDKCQYKKIYPKSYLFGNRAKKEFIQKKELITNLKKLTLTEPSFWLKQQVEMSYLKGIPNKVVHNFIDTKIFKPTQDNEIKRKYNIKENKKIILGVAAQWGKNKGIEYFEELSKIIDNQKELIVMVGVTKKQKEQLPKNIIGIERTEDINELVKLYSIADVFFNPSIQETFSLVTIEAIACGTPCIVFDSTATPELIKENVGKIVKNYKIENIKEIYTDIRTLMEKGKDEKNFVEYAKKYDKENYKQFIDIYNTL